MALSEVQRVLARWQTFLDRYGIAFLCAGVSLLYLPSLGGDFLPYDDDWLIQNNRWLEAPPRAALYAIFFDLSRETRLALGAEYLPLRDLSHYAEVALFGRSAFGMRLVQLGLYLAALVAFADALRLLLPRAWFWVTLIVYAVHPSHVESVAWLAGRKDVLGLLFLFIALSCYVRGGRRQWWVVPLVTGATLSKSMSVIGPGLLIATDLLGGRRPQWAVITGTVLGAGLVWLVQANVGETVGMVGGPLADSRVTAFWTMGEVWVRYALMLCYSPALSIVHQIAPVVHPTWMAALGWSAFAVSLGWALWRAVRGATFPLGVALWIWLPLLPVSQIMFPLQNVMADRYLWLTPVGLGLALGVCWSRHAIAQWTITVAVLLLSVGVVHRAALFGDAVALFADASRKSNHPRGPYLMAYELAKRGETELAVEAYEEALRRPCANCEEARRAANNLAVLYVASERVDRAEAVLRRSISAFADDAKAHFNLVRVLTRLGKRDEARRLYDQARLRFPDYDASDAGASRALH